MPTKLESCVKQVIEQGYTKQQAYAICTTALDRALKEKEKQKNTTEQSDVK